MEALRDGALDWMADLVMQKAGSEDDNLDSFSGSSDASQDASRSMGGAIEGEYTMNQEDDDDHPEVSLAGWCQGREAGQP